jgi:hypothetical protein
MPESILKYYEKINGIYTGNEVNLVRFILNDIPHCT